MGAFIGFSANPVAAETDRERATARRLASAGAKAYSAGDYDRAVDRLRRAEKLVHSPVHLLYIARAQRELGQLVSAQENFLKVTREDLDSNDPRPWRDAQRDARKELAKLEPRVPTVTIEVKGRGADEATVVIDGEDTPAELIGVAQPIDPGEHKVLVKAPGRRSKTVKFSIGEGETKAVTLKLRKFKASDSGDDSDAGEDGASDGNSVVPYVAIGLGGAALIAGGVFFLRWQSLSAEAGRKMRRAG